MTSILDNIWQEDGIARRLKEYLEAKKDTCKDALLNVQAFDVIKIAKLQSEYSTYDKVFNEITNIEEELNSKIKGDI